MAYQNLILVQSKDSEKMYNVLKSFPERIDDKPILICEDSENSLFKMDTEESLVNSDNISPDFYCMFDYIEENDLEHLTDPITITLRDSIFGFPDEFPQNESLLYSWVANKEIFPNLEPEERLDKLNQMEFYGRETETDSTYKAIRDLKEQVQTRTFEEQR